MRDAKTIASSGSNGALDHAFDGIPLVRSIHVKKLAEHLVRGSGSSGPLSPDLARQLQSLEEHCTFSRGGRAAFHDLLARVGVTTTHDINLPLDDQPFWFRCGHPLAGFQSHDKLPTDADVVIIGAGLTGASAAYHLADAAQRDGKKILVLDRGDPAGEASGRNGGNFELIPENSVGIYEGLAHERLGFLKRCYPGCPDRVVRAECERQASLVLGIALRNRDRLREIIRRENIDCDFSPRGWLYLAHTEQEEQAICEEVMLAAQHGQRIEIWSRRKILDEFGIRTEFLGRFIPGDGCYHPFKYVCGMLKCAIARGVELYTRLRVLAVDSKSADRHIVRTERGEITTRSVIVATNAFTGDLFPELKAITPRQSQVMVTEHAPDRTRGRVVTTEIGPTFFSQPREGAHNGRAPLLMGGGHDRPMNNPASRRRSPQVHGLLLKLRDVFYPELRGQPPSAEWVGPMAFTPDELPAIGFLREGVIIAAGYNGYGGSYTTAAGEAAAQMALSGNAPQWAPEDVFSPRRLLAHEPLFMRQHDSLWRIAASLCRQLRAVNRQIADAVRATGGGDTRMLPPPAAASAAGIIAELSSDHHAPAERSDVELMSTFALFRDFSADELARICGMTRRWSLPANSVVCTEGGPGGSCFFLLSGVVGVTVHDAGREQRVARLVPGSVFGQVSLIENEPRSATCTVLKDAVLLEMSRDECRTLLDTRCETATKLLAALNEGLIVALRAADRYLMRLTIHDATAAPDDQPEAVLSSSERV
jgi:glycine/D-amino acid oxidase-like deaminating enzyme